MCRMPVHEAQNRKDSESTRAAADDDAQLMEGVISNDGVGRGCSRSLISISSLGAACQHIGNAMAAWMGSNAYSVSWDWAPGMPFGRSNLRPKPWPVKHAER